MRPFARANAAEIRTQHDVAQRKKSLRKRGHHLVVLGSALQRVGVGDERDRLPRRAGIVDVDFDLADGS
ncbi:hypothetical protein D3C83_19500 [compost metagenome]